MKSTETFSSSYSGSRQLPLPKFMRLKRFKFCVAFFVIFIVYVSLFSVKATNDGFSIAGGVVGAVSVLIVIGDIYYKHKIGDISGQYSLLLWRAICDLGLACRFILIPFFNQLLCNDWTCDRNNADESRCVLPSMMLEFFAISSEAWFLCNGIDLYYSVTNPFSSFKARLPFYHLLTWTVTVFLVLIAFFPGDVTRVYGFWYVNQDLNSSAVCWLRNDADFSWPIFGLFITPLFFVYGVCVVALLVAYRRLRRGITRTFLPRMKLLVTNTINVLCLILYWMVLLVFYGCAFWSSQGRVSSGVNNILSFMLASKGFSAFMVGMLIPGSHASATKNKFAPDQADVLETVDANRALREEVLNFATAGIRSSARSSGSASIDRRQVSRRPRQRKRLSDIAMHTRELMTPVFFLRFVLGQPEEVNALLQVISSNRRSVMDGALQEEPEAMTPSHGQSGRPVELSARFSQRPTLPMGDTAMAEMIEADSRAGSGGRKGRMVSTETEELSMYSTFDGRNTHVVNHTNNNNLLSMIQAVQQGPDSNRPSTSSNAPPVAMKGLPRGVQPMNVGHSTDVESGSPFTSVESAEQRVVEHLRQEAEEQRRRSSQGPGDPRMTEASLRPSEMVETEQKSEILRKKKAVVEQSVWLKIQSYFSLGNLDKSDFVEFTEFEPFQFRRIRLSLGISDVDFSSCFSTTIKERLTEGGASGSFFFFSKGERFIAKSCTQAEMDGLRNNAIRYADYLVSAPDSFVSKIFGAYRLEIYGNSLNFFVMNNLFLNADRLEMNEKYDIKGSWESRNAALPRDGMRVTCTHCEQKFIFKKRSKGNRRGSRLMKDRTISGSQQTIEIANLRRSQEENSALTLTALHELAAEGGSGRPSENVAENSSARGTMPSGQHTVESSVDRSDAPDLGLLQHCPYTVNGQHEPNRILKDNDIKYKIRLPMHTALSLVRQLRSDAEFLCSIGVMDYSLLVGVHNTEYEVMSEGAGLDPDGQSPLSGSGSSTPNQPLLRRTSLTASARSSSISVTGNTPPRSSSYQRDPRDRESVSHKPFQAALPQEQQPNPDQIPEADPRGEPPEVVSRESRVGHAGDVVGKMLRRVGDDTLDREGQVSNPLHAPSELSGQVRRSSDSESDDLQILDEQLSARKLEVLRVVGPDAYFMGIIDYQQTWGFKKQMERFFKIHFRGCDPDGLSAIEPESYKERFLRKMEDIIDFDSAGLRSQSTQL